MTEVQKNADHPGIDSMKKLITISQCPMARQKVLQADDHETPEPQVVLYENDHCHLGNFGTRFGGQRLEYVPATQRITRCGGGEVEANALLSRSYQADYELSYQG